MPFKSPQKRVEDAFDEKTCEAFGERYLELLYANWSELTRTLRRTVVLLVILAAGFLLLNSAKSAELTLGPLKTSNIAAVLTLIPAVTSFLLFEAIDLTLAGSYYRDTAGALMKKLHKSVYENDLEMLLEPTTTFAWGGGFTTGITPPSSGKIAALLEAIAVLLALGVIFSVGGFLVYAYMWLYNSSNTNSLAVTASLAFAIFNIGRAGLQIAFSFKEDDGSLESGA